MTVIKKNLSKATLKQINDAVNVYKENIGAVERNANNIYTMLGDFVPLREHVHSLKHRVKDPEHLREKLERQARRCIEEGKQFSVNDKNIFQKITDLAGVRILHLHTRQTEKIDLALRALFKEQAFKIVEGPIASTWDPEYAQYFSSIGMKTRTTGTFYTSVHYIIGANDLAKTRCEIQVRTLMEEVWGEMSHSIDYPNATPSVACKEQLKVLARVTSSGTRLVDSIFRSHEEYSQLTDE